MTTRLPYKTTFEPERVIQPIFTGGSVALDNGARILATTLGEDAVLTDLKTGRQYAKMEGVCLSLCQKKAMLEYPTDREPSTYRTMSPSPR